MENLGELKFQNTAAAKFRFCDKFCNRVVKIALNRNYMANRDYLREICSEVGLCIKEPSGGSNRSLFLIHKPNAAFSSSARNGHEIAFDQFCVWYRRIIKGDFTEPYEVDAPEAPEREKIEPVHVCLSMNIFEVGGKLNQVIKVLNDSPEQKPVKPILTVSLPSSYSMEKIERNVKNPDIEKFKEDYHVAFLSDDSITNVKLAVLSPELLTEETAKVLNQRIEAFQNSLNQIK